MTMRHRLTIEKDQRAGRKHLWRMRGTLRKGEPRYDKSFPSLKAAERERNRLEQDLDSAAGLPTEVIRHTRIAHDLLATTTNQDAIGLDLLFAIRWFCSHYRNTSGELSVADYVGKYLALVKTTLRPRTHQEAAYYLKKFEAGFGARKPSTVTADELDGHLSTLNHRFNRDKVLRAFWRWMAGGKRKRLAALQHPPLIRSPFDFITAPGMPSRKAPPLILTPAEIKELLRRAARFGTIDYVSAGLFLGLRPESELVPFMRYPDLIDLAAKQVVLRGSKVPEAIERDIHIRPGLLKSWGRRTKLFVPPDLTRRLRATKAFLSPEKYNESDILRHTYLSNLVVAEGVSVAVMEGGTSIKKLKTNYWRRVSKAQGKAYFKTKIPRVAKVLSSLPKDDPKHIDQVIESGSGTTDLVGAELELSDLGGDVKEEAQVGL